MKKIVLFFSKTIFIRVLFTVALLLNSLPVAGYILDGFKIQDAELLTYAKEKLPSTGVLKKTNKGFVYVDIANKHVLSMLKQFNANHCDMTYNNAGNAHITVMLEYEAFRKSIVELGAKISFKPLGFYSAVVDDREYFMLAVESPELSKIRMKYGLAPRIDGHAFHITIGVRQIVAEDEMADVG